VILSGAKQDLPGGEAGLHGGVSSSGLGKWVDGGDAGSEEARGELGEEKVGSCTEFGLGRDEVPERRPGDGQ
jgi:hypothetical protein